MTNPTTISGDEGRRVGAESGCGSRRSASSRADTGAGLARPGPRRRAPARRPSGAGTGRRSTTMQRPMAAAPTSVADVDRGLRSVGYLPGESTALVSYLAAKLGKPILVEGPAGVGKTELAKALVALPRPPAGAAAVLRGARRGQGAVRVELPQAAAAHPGRGRGHGLGRGPGRHLRRGVPARAPAHDGDRLRASRSCC